LHMAQLIPLSLASVKSRLVLLFWYRLTWVVPEKGPLNGRVCDGMSDNPDTFLLIYIAKFCRCKLHVHFTLECIFCNICNRNLSAVKQHKMTIMQLLIFVTTAVK